jgi:hypothetical protein
MVGDKLLPIMVNGVPCIAAAVVSYAVGVLTGL